MTDETEGKPIPEDAPVFVDPKGDASLQIPPERKEIFDLFHDNSELSDEEQEEVEKTLEEVDVDAEEIVAELEADLEDMEKDTDD